MVKARWIRLPLMLQASKWLILYPANNIKFRVLQNQRLKSFEWQNSAIAKLRNSPSWKIPTLKFISKQDFSQKNLNLISTLWFFFRPKTEPHRFLSKSDKTKNEHRIIWQRGRSITVVRIIRVRGLLLLFFMTHWSVTRKEITLVSFYHDECSCLDSR